LGGELPTKHRFVKVEGFFAIALKM
jgi:hypothetical protein